MLTVTKNVYLCFDNYIYAIHTSQIPYPVHQHCPTTYCITELTYSSGAVSISREEHAFRLVYKHRINHKSGYEPYTQPS